MQASIVVDEGSMGTGMDEPPPNLNSFLLVCILNLVLA